MAFPILMIPVEKLRQLGLKNTDLIHYQLSPAELVEQTLRMQQGQLSESGALVVETGQFTGRCPKDKFIVNDRITVDAVDWNDFNIPIEEKYFLQLHKKITSYLDKKEIWVRDCYASAEGAYRLNIRIITETPWSSLFAHNMFLRPDDDELEDFVPDWHVLQAPGFKANPQTDGTRTENFAIISFLHRTILIGGTAYTGEIKKGIFTVLNFLLPLEKNVLSMHCSANMGEDGDTAIFFGLSGTGKTTLSTDPERLLIGDDEHGWTDDSLFNFEGGCYAKCIDLSEEKEPEIFNAIHRGALVENTVFFLGTNKIDFSNRSITENTRVSYPLDHITNVLEPSIGAVPKNIFFLTCDAYGVLPPISKLTTEQAMYQFISGYTAKVAGTESGITEPKPTFSACFGAPFMPLHPGLYARMLGNKIRESNATVWLINTGWTGGPHGIGSRMNLQYTRAMISAVLKGDLEEIKYEFSPFFKLAIPKSCPGVPTEILHARNTWEDKNAFDEQAKKLANFFINNFSKYAAGIDPEILQAAPQVV